MVDESILEEIRKKFLFRFPNLGMTVKGFGPDTVMMTISWCSEAQKNRVEANLHKWLKNHRSIKKYSVRIKVG